MRKLNISVHILALSVSHTHTHTLYHACETSRQTRHPPRRHPHLRAPHYCNHIKNANHIPMQPFPDYQQQCQSGRNPGHQLRRAALLTRAIPQLHHAPTRRPLQQATPNSGRSSSVSGLIGQPTFLRQDLLHLVGDRAEGAARGIAELARLDARGTPLLLPLDLGQHKVLHQVARDGTVA